MLENVHRCKDCKVDVFESPKNHYMITFYLWKQYGVGKGFLCMDCIEHRIGHKLKKEDLLDCPLNTELNPYTMEIWRQS